MSVMFCGSVWIQFTTLLWMTICLFCRNKVSLKWKTQCLCFTSPQHEWGPHHWHGPCSEPFSANLHFLVRMEAWWTYYLCSSKHFFCILYRIGPYASIQSFLTCLWGFRLFLSHINLYEASFPPSKPYRIQASIPGWEILTIQPTSPSP